MWKSTTYETISSPEMHAHNHPEKPASSPLDRGQGVTPRSGPRLHFYYPVTLSGFTKLLCLQTGDINEIRHEKAPRTSAWTPANID